MNVRSLIVAAILAFFAVAVDGAIAEPEPVVIDGRPFLKVLGPHLSLLRDPGGTLTFDDVASAEMAGRFDPVQAQVPSLGFTRDTIWLFFTLQSQADLTKTLIVELGMTRLSDFEWFVTGAESVAEGLANTRFPTLEIRVPAGGTCRVYARARSDTSVWLPMVAGSPAAFAGHAARRDFRDFAQAGFCTALAIMGLGLWSGRRRNRLYLGVAVAMSGAVLYFTIFNGLYAWLGGPWPQWMGRRGILISVLLFSFMFTKFTRDFLGRENLSCTGNVLFAVCHALFLVMVVLCVLLPYPVAVKLVQPVQLLAFGVAAGVTVRRMIVVRGRGMELFVLAWAVLLSGTVFFVLQLNGLIPLVPVSPYDALLFVFSSVFLLFLLAGANSQQAALRMEARLAELGQAETEARLAALRNQLDPHFLFNTLASIEELSHEAPDRIPALIARLSAFLRRRLGPDVASMDIALADEIEAVRDYLAIEDVRFEQRLKVSFDIEAAAADCKVPELVLLPLVENAVKHGFAAASNVAICISAQLRRDSLCLRVENNGSLDSPAPQSRGTGTGLENLRARLRLRHGEAASFSIRQESDRTVLEVILPAVKEQP